MRHFVTEMCAYVHISVIKWCIVRYETDALRDIFQEQTLVRLKIKTLLFSMTKLQMSSAQFRSFCSDLNVLTLLLLNMMTSSNGNIFRVTGHLCTQRPVTRSFDVYFDLRPNERLNKQSWGWWFETPSHPYWRHRNELGWLWRTRTTSLMLMTWRRKEPGHQQSWHWMCRMIKSFYCLCYLNIEELLKSYFFLYFLK